MIEFNIKSNHHLSLLLFGGQLVDKVPEEFLGAKGQIRTRNVEIVRNIKGLGFKPLDEWKTKTDGIYSTKEEVLVKLLEQDNPEGCKVIESMLKIKNLNKQLSTYYTGVKTLIYPDKCVHSQFQTVETETGRYSCKGPNIQNVPDKSDSDIKKHFTSRWKDGILIEYDMRQIEIVVQAELCKDPQYMQDVKDGVDFHIKRLALKEGVSYGQAKHYIQDPETHVEWSTKRKKVKAWSLGDNYGIGLQKAIQKSGLSREEVLELTKIKEREYPRLTVFNNQLAEFVKFTAKDGDTGYYFSPTGRRFYFTAEDTPLWLKKKGVHKSFRPSSMKNYIIQGTAFDIMALLLGYVWRNIALYNRNKFLMVNTVHDSIKFDCKDNLAAEELKALMNMLIVDRIPDIIKDKFGIDWELNIGLDVKQGKSWFDC